MYKHNSWFIITAVIGRRQKKIKLLLKKNGMCKILFTSPQAQETLLSGRNRLLWTENPPPLFLWGHMGDLQVAKEQGTVCFSQGGELVEAWWKRHICWSHRDRERERERLQTHGTARNLQPQTEEPRRQSLVDTNTEVQVKESLAATSWRLTHRTTSNSKETVGNIRWWGNLSFAEMMVNTVFGQNPRKYNKQTKINQTWKYYYNN